MSRRLFEAFFWIQPTRKNIKSSFTSTQILWTFPEDVTKITTEFRDIPQFCFPDLEKIHLEHPESSRNEHFVFTLTEQDGNRVYGVCMRALIHGEGGRYDAKRRYRHCLCVITRQSCFATIRTLLLQLHGLTVMELKAGAAQLFLQELYHQEVTPASLDSSVAMLTKSKRIYTVSTANFPTMLQDFNLSVPPQCRATYQDMSLLPLLEVLGVERFMLLLGAALYERRIIFIADDAETLSSTVFATVAMLRPFHWQHIIIPLVPSRLLSYAAAPMPYIIGVRRYLVDTLLKEDLGEVFIVDADSGECTTRGGMVLRDFVGESGTTLKAASENFDRVKEQANMFMQALTGGGGGSPVGVADRGDLTPRDIVAAMFAELRTMLAAKPGGGSFQAVAGGLFRGKSTTLEESKVQWGLEAEKTLKDCLLHFYVYVFGDLDKQVFESHLMVSPRDDDRGVAGRDEAFGSGDSRASFDLATFEGRRSSLGDAIALQEFISGFLHSQMFERFCADRLHKLRSRYAAMMARRGGGVGVGMAAGGSEAGEDDPYDMVLLELRKRKLPHSVVNVKTAVTAVRAGSSNNSADTTSLLGPDYHNLAVLMTAGALPLVGATAAVVSGGMSTKSPQGSSHGQGGLSMSHAIDKICADAFNSDSFAKIMRTVRLRLESCLASGGRGGAGTAGQRTLSLLRSLLLQGPECVLSEALGLLPAVHEVLVMTATQVIGGQATLDFISQGAPADLRPITSLVLQLLLDHKKLIHQRNYLRLSRSDDFAYLNNGSVASITSSSSSSAFTGVGTATSSKQQFLRFDSLHAAMKPAVYARCSPQAHFLLLTESVAHCRGAEEEDDNDAEDIYDVHSGGSGPSTSRRSPAVASRNAAVNPDTAVSGQHRVGTLKSVQSAVLSSHRSAL